MQRTSALARRALAAALLLSLPMAAAAQSGPLLKSATWWNPDESGWGLFTIDQGNVIVPGWFTYGPDGKPTWFLVPGATLQSDGSYTGNVCRHTGIPFAQISGNAADPCQIVGTARLRFTSHTALNFSYTVDGQTQTKSLTRFGFDGRDIVCRASPTTSRAGATNFSDLWWSGPTSEGWGMHMSHFNDRVIATWYTYDTDRKAIFYLGLTTKQADGSFTGQLFRQNNGTPFNLINGAPPTDGSTQVGTLRLSFSDGQTANFSYTVGNVTQTKPLTRITFGDTATVCEHVAFGSVGGNTAGPDECYPPLAVGDKFRIRNTPMASGTATLADVEVIGTGVDPFEGRPVFRIRSTPLDQTNGDVIEFVEQTATERIYYGAEGFIPEANARGTTRFVPPVRVPRATPVGHTGTLTYQAISNYTAQGQAVTATVNFVERYNRVGTETQTVPAGTFADACRFDTSFTSDVTIPTDGVSVRTRTEATVTQWAHPSIGPLRTTNSSTTTVTTTGAPFPIPPTTTTANDLSEILSAVIGGRSFP